MSLSSSLSEPLVADDRLAPRLWKRVSLCFSAFLGAVLVALFFTYPTQFDTKEDSSEPQKSLHRSPLEQIGGHPSVTETLRLFPSPQKVQQVNDLFVHLPAHDQEDVVLLHISLHAERIFLDFLEVFGSTAPIFETRARPEKPRHKLKNDKEFSHRLNIFKDTLRSIVQQNKFEARHSSRPDRAIFGITKFADWTWSEFQTMLTKRPSTDDNIGRKQHATSTTTTTTTPCVDTPGSGCEFFSGADCKEEVASVGYTDAQQTELFQACRKTCNLCRQAKLALEPRNQTNCTDIAGFRDARGYRCLHWVGYDCFAAVDHFGYTQADENDLLRACKSSCDLCGYRESRLAPCSINWASKYPWVFQPLNQQHCASCYAFAAVEQLRALAFINSGIDPGELSTQFVMDCYGQGCRGGLAGEVMDWVHGQGGIPTRSAYGCYVGEEKSCKSGVPKSVKTSGVEHFYDEYSTAVKLCSDGPLSMGVYANAAWKNYVSGVISHHSCPPRFANHDVQVVGLLQEEGAWIIRNSWGSDFGVSAKPPYSPNGSDAGFIMIEYGHNACNCVDGSSFPQDVSCIGSCSEGTTSTANTDSPMPANTTLCSNVCYLSYNGLCEDEGSGCYFGTDCHDCGPRIKTFTCVDQ